LVVLLQDLLTNSAHSHPFRPAIKHGSEVITYNELDTQSDEIARGLLKHGVTKSDRVGIYFDKSIKSIISIFAVLKAGAVYVPLDPVAPVSRIILCITDCKVSSIFTSSRLWRQLNKSLLQITALELVILIDEEKENSLDPSHIKTTSWTSLSTLNSGPSVYSDSQADELAYILYTSGSSGAPKGVAVSHRASLAFVEWSVNEFRLNPDDRVSSVAPLHFDLSIFDIFASIKAGSLIVIVPPSLFSFPNELAKFIHQENISVWYSVPTILRWLIVRGAMDRFSYESLRVILFAGEVFPTKYLRMLMTCLPSVDFFNLFGPTETNVCTFYKVPLLNDGDDTPIPIGNVCAGNRAWIVDEDDRIMPDDDEGELCISGPTVMSGYWGDSTATGRNMIAVATSGTSPIIAYKTGDLVRKDDSGLLHFLGRRDNMIKRLGYRIHLAEIEKVLNANPAVELAAADSYQDEKDITNIAVFLVFKKPDRLSENQLNSFLLQHLPTYMIPSKYIFPTRLPLTSNGKIDRHSLKENLLKMVNKFEQL